MNKNRILIATATAGGGHLQAAAALEEAWKTFRPKDTVERVDVLDYTPKLYRKAYAEGYVKLAEKVPELYAHAFRTSDSTAFIRKASRMRRWTARWVARKFIKHLSEFQPDILLCPHFLPIEVMGSLENKKLPYKKPLTVCVVTDFEAHALWMESAVDLYCVAAPETKARLVARGIPDAKVIVTGIPVSKRFAKAAPKAPLRKRLSLLPSRPTLLVLGGGMGMGPLVETLKELDRMKEPTQRIVVAGRNEALKQKLENQTFLHPTKVFGFVTNMEDLMNASDLIVTKSGGLTSSESLALGKPLLIVNPLPGQEAANSDYLLERGAAAKANRLEDLAFRADGLIRNGKLKSMSQSARQLGRPQAASAVCRAAMKALRILPVALMLAIPVMADLKPECPIKKDEEAILYPAWAWQSKPGNPWFTEIQAWVYEPETDSLLRRGLLKALRKQLGVPEESMENTLFVDRTSGFLVDSERGKELTVQIHAQQVKMPLTNGGGKTELVVQLDWPAVSTTTPATMTLVGCEASGRPTESIIRAIAPAGITLISDVDDTIKVSEVRDRSRMLSRALLQPYEAVTGMAAVYQAAVSRGAVVHYVSAAPSPLYLSLRGFLNESGYPDGPLVLKPFRPKSRDLFKLGKPADVHKKSVIHQIAERWPGRGLVLIGDSGERDPEIYAALAEELKSQVRLVAIRELDGDLTNPRYSKAFRHLPAAQWMVFSDPLQLSAALKNISK